jgi:hypothetical protein
MVVLAFAAVAAIENAGEIIRERRNKEREREREERERETRDHDR